jgi:demethoxyubiquinone hydroxylase (CLK1/Coq7/Cat5 family)
LEQRLHTHLDQRCVVTRKGNQVFIDIVDVFTEDELEHKARGVLRVWEWAAA